MSERQHCIKLCQLHTNKWSPYLEIASADQDAYNTADYPNMTGQSVGVVHGDQSISSTNKRLSKRVTFKEPLVFDAQGDDQHLHVNLHLTLNPGVRWPQASATLEPVWLADLQDAIQLELTP